MIIRVRIRNKISDEEKKWLRTVYPNQIILTRERGCNKLVVEQIESIKTKWIRTQSNHLYSRRSGRGVKGTISYIDIKENLSVKDTLTLRSVYETYRR